MPRTASAFRANSDVSRKLAEKSLRLDKNIERELEIYKYIRCREITPFFIIFNKFFLFLELLQKIIEARVRQTSFSL